MPEIYEMQARALFEATVENMRSGINVTPEIMIPLVSPIGKWKSSGTRSQGWPKASKLNTMQNSTIGWA